MEGSYADDSVTNRIVKQLNADFEEISRVLDYYQLERAQTVRSQNQALASYDAEIRAIEGSVDAQNIDEVTGQVDHNVLRHLNIEKDSEQYKKFEYPNPSGLTEKLQKNIENLQTMPTLNETVHVPSLEEKANIREKMFSFLDESRMEETRLELEYDQAKAHNDHKLAEEIAEALFILQKSNSENLVEMITNYRPSAFGKTWGNDAEYVEMVKNLGTINHGHEEEGTGLPPRVGKNGKKKRSGH